MMISTPAMIFPPHPRLTRLIVLFTFVLAASALPAQILVNFNVSNGLSDTVGDTRLNVSDLTAGSNLSIGTITSGQWHYEVDGWPATATTNPDNMLSFTVENTSASDVTINAMSFLYKVTNKGPDSAQVFIAVDNVGFDSEADYTALTTLELDGIGTSYPSDFDLFGASGTVNLSVGATATVYIVGSGAESNGQTAAQLTNIRLYSVSDFGNGGSPVPEPSSFAMLAGLGAIGFAATRRRRRS